MEDPTKVRRIVEWVTAVLVGLSFIASGIPKIVPGDSMVGRFEAWGYTAGFASAVGVAELLGGLMILLPRSRPWGALVLAVIMIGAVFTHVRTGIGSPTMAGVYLGLSLLVLWTSSRPSGGT